MDYLSFGGTAPDGTEAKPLSIDRIHSFSAVLQRAFRYAVFPKKYISFNYKEVREKNRVYYELYSLDGTQEVPEDYTEISLVYVRQDGMYLGREALDWMCRSSWDIPQ